MARHQVLSDRQTKPDTLHTGFNSRRPPVERLDYPLHFIDGYSRTTVAHIDFQKLSRQSGIDRDRRSLRRVFDGISQNIRQTLDSRPPIYRQRRQFQRHVETDAYVLLVRIVLEELRRQLDNRADLDTFDLQVPAVRLKGGKLEQVVDKVCQ